MSQEEEEEEEERERWESLSHQLDRLYQEAIQLAGQVQQGLQQRATPVDVPTLITRWEQGETVAAALAVCQHLLAQDDPEEVRHLSRQLRRWRRLEGLLGVGWIEARKVNGYGPYVYYRWRTVEWKISTQYYGRMDRVQRWMVKALWKEGEAGQ